MPVPTNRVTGGTVQAADINAIATLVNANEAAITALDAAKAPKANAVFTGTFTIPDAVLSIAKVAGLQTALNGKAATTAIPDEALDINALPLNIRRWSGTAWSARPTVPGGISVEAYSDGSYGSVRDTAAPAPPSSVLGDAWTRAV